MVARADAGDIVAQRAVPITDDDTALTLYRKIVPLGAALIREYHPLIVAGTRAAPSAGSHCRAVISAAARPDDGRIDWRWPARRIFNLVRAVTHPYPGAFCFIGGRKLYVWRRQSARNPACCGEPGAIIAEQPRWCDRGCGGRGQRRPQSRAIRGRR